MPVCSKFFQYNRAALATSNNSNNSNNSNVRSKLYNLSVCLISRVDNVQKLQEFFEYYLMQEIDHFYFYHHLYGYSSAEKAQAQTRLFHTAFEGYISRGIVTYIEWYVPATPPGSDAEQPWYLWSSINHCIYQFRDESRFFAILDDDIRMYPRNLNHTILQQVLQIKGKGKEETGFNNYFQCSDCMAVMPAFEYFASAVTANKDSAIKDNQSAKEEAVFKQKFTCDLRFDSFLERHSCIGGRCLTRYIAYADAIDYGFVHDMTWIVRFQRERADFDSFLCSHETTKLYLYTRFSAKLSQTDALKFLLRKSKACAESSVVRYWIDRHKQSLYFTNKSVPSYIDHYGSFCNK